MKHSITAQIAAVEIAVASTSHIVKGRSLRASQGDLLREQLDAAERTLRWVREHEATIRTAIEATTAGKGQPG